MANETMSIVDQDIGKSSIVANSNVKDSQPKYKKRRGIFSQIWNGLFKTGADDFEKRLQHISKVEVTVLARLNKRSQFWRRWAIRMIILSISIEIIAVGYAIIMTRSSDLNWKTRAFRVLPMFLFPVLYFLAYTTLRGLRTLYDRKDQKTLERLRAEKKAKIDELKEKTNYYSTQQLIQRYDTDPAAKAAAASVLASKLGADSGLKVFLEGSFGEGGDVEVMKPSSSGIRNRKHHHPSRTSSSPTSLSDHCNEEEKGDDEERGGGVIMEEQHRTTTEVYDGGWLARLVALLMADDPKHSYALVCTHCHRHNGLAKEEELAFITYYCPHCHTLNNPKHMQSSSDGSSPPLSDIGNEGD